MPSPPPKITRLTICFAGSVVITAFVLIGVFISQNVGSANPYIPSCESGCPFYSDPTKMLWWYPLRDSYADYTGKTTAQEVAVSPSCTPYFLNFSLPMGQGPGPCWYSPPCAQGVVVTGQSLTNSYSASAWLNLYGDGGPMAWQGSPMSASFNNNAILVGPSFIGLVHSNVTAADSEIVPIAARAWVHIAITYDDPNNLAAFYVNGVLSGGEYLLPTTPSFDQVSPHPSTVLGADPPNTAFSGYILRWRVFNYALNSTEVTQLFAADSTNLTAS